MRIAQITYSTRPRGGVVHTLALAEALARRGHDVTVWTLGRGGDAAFFRPVDPRVTVRVVPFAPRDDETIGARIVRSIRVMGAALARERGAGAAHVVHAQDCISANAAAAAGVDVVRTVHHLDEFTTPELVRCHDLAVTAPVARLCVSRAVAREVHDAYGLAPTVIPNGVDAARFAAAAGPAGAASRQAWQARLGAYVLALGGIEPRKGTLDLLEACAVLRRTHPSVRLVLGGGETLFDYRPYRARFEERAAELGVEPVVLGTLADDDVPPLVAAAAVLAMVSTKEGFGLAAMEGLAAGVPVVARDLPVTREVFGEHVAYGRDVPSIAAALSDALDGVRAAGADAGRALAAHHSWDAAAAAHERFYRVVVAEGGDGGAPVDLAGRQPAGRR
ncbi:MSMEG_0565 family glycosyltransferase [Cellulomonas dongxiuzhuiae]|uniref:MSMEG_0565 family glycosyltransferase n=1 Tax=Cellulomonas dongxiuzhuiae TaxID=2819979 RepID=UPI001AB00A90|nr:MSMEG_0565 family glycosyltransferase [Cellulomonas dongxiuzhuiae]MBO3087143.1 MSMEG_0565 family glycosyltransferase [Cellulomonas dongxiuzhuiae]